MTLQTLLMLKDVVDNHKVNEQPMVVCANRMVRFTPRPLKLFTKEQLIQLFNTSQVTVNDRTITFTVQ